MVSTIYNMIRKWEKERKRGWIKKNKK